MVYDIFPPWLLEHKPLIALLELWRLVSVNMLQVILFLASGISLTRVLISTQLHPILEGDSLLIFEVLAEKLLFDLY